MDDTQQKNTAPTSHELSKPVAYPRERLLSDEEKKSLLAESEAALAAFNAHYQKTP